MPRNEAVPGYEYRAAHAGEGGLHLLCVGISRYEHDPLSFTAISALRVFAWFVEAAQASRLQLASATLYVAPSAAEEQLIMQHRPKHHAFLTSARGSGSKDELERVVNAWVTKVRGDARSRSLFYFAGHGFGLKGATSDLLNTAMICSDFADDRSLPPKAVALQHVVNAMCSANRDDAVPADQLYLLDCCRERSWDRRPPEQGQLRIRIDDLQHADAHHPDTRRIALQFACWPGSTTAGMNNAEDGSTEDYSYYSDALIGTLNAAPGEVTSLWLLSETSRRLSAAHPDLKTDEWNRGGEFSLVGPAAGAQTSSPASATASARSVELASRSQRTRGAGPKRGWLLAVGSLCLASAAAYASLAPNPSPLAPEILIVPAGPFQRGSTMAEARTAFAQCRATADRLGPARPPLPCDCPFESSALLRETWIAREEVLAPFSIDRHEVTNAEFAAWLNESARELHVVPPSQGVPVVIKDQTVIAGVLTGDHDQPMAARIRSEQGRYTVATADAQLPVVSVTWHGADAYCRSRGQRLPSEAEWEYAARGAERRTFAFGSAEAASCAGMVFGRAPGAECSALPARPAPAGASPIDRTPEGVQDLAGNVEEWVQDPWLEPAGFVDTCTGHEQAAALRASQPRVIRGGGFGASLPSLRAAVRARATPTRLGTSVGFRCARGGAPP